MGLAPFRSRLARRHGTLFVGASYSMSERFMKAYLNNLSTRTWLLLVTSAVLLVYPVARVVVPAVVHAVVPEVVRSVLSVI